MTSIFVFWQKCIRCFILSALINIAHGISQTIDRTIDVIAIKVILNSMSMLNFIHWVSFVKLFLFRRNLYNPRTVVNVATVTVLTVDTKTYKKAWAQWCIGLSIVLYHWNAPVDPMNVDIGDYISHIWPKKACSNVKGWSPQCAVFDKFEGMAYRHVSFDCQDDVKWETNCWE